MDKKAAVSEQGRPEHAKPIHTVLRLDAAAPRAARLFVADVLGGLGLGTLIDDAALLVSELATNAFLHAGGEEIDVTVLPEDGRVVFKIFDADEVLPRSRQMPPIDPRNPESLPEGSFGLAIIAEVATSWGRHPVPGGKWTWFTLATPEARTS